MSMFDQLSASTLLSGLSQTHIAVLASAAQEVTFAAGERLFEEGAPAKGCWLVQRGCVAIDAGIPGRGPVVVQTVGPGEVVGWSWLITPARWHFGAIAVAPTAAIELDTDQLLDLYRNPADTPMSPL